LTPFTGAASAVDPAPSAPSTTTRGVDEVGVARAHALPPGTGAAPDFWSLLSEAQTSEQLCRAWLGILCEWVPGTRAGLLLLHEPAGGGPDALAAEPAADPAAQDRYVPAAVWPDPARDLSHLAGVAEAALAQRRTVVEQDGAGLAQCAYPLLSAQQAYGVVVLQIAVRTGAPLRDALRLLHWGAGWLVDLFDKRELLQREQRLAQSALVQDLLQGLLAEPGAEASARYVVNRLAQGLPCRQAILALPAKGVDDPSGAPAAAGTQPVMKLAAVSGTAGFEPRSTLLAAAREALQEAADSGRPEQLPSPAAASGAPPVAALLAASPLADYRQEAGADTVLALPLQQRGLAVGALLLEFERPPSAATVALAQTAALALAPALALHTRAARSLPRHAREAAAGGLRALFGPSRPGLKALALLGSALLVAAALWPVPHRVSAPATVEGRVQRAAVAPFSGFLLESAVRAGDTVRAGDVLARLDDRELRLEEARWQALAEVADRRAREALARSAAVAVQLARAEADEAEAQLALVRSRLARAAITAPFDGVVVRGDLTQQLGAPVEQGTVLFEVAPLDAWRVVLKVDERDVLKVRDGADAELVLSGLPGVRHTLRVRQVSPVAVAEDGRNAFRVEAEVVDASPQIQPGMQGVGKVHAGERSLLYIAFHRLWNGLRFTAWSWGL